MEQIFGILTCAVCADVCADVVCTCSTTVTRSTWALGKPQMTRACCTTASLAWQRNACPTTCLQHLQWQWPRRQTQQQWQQRPARLQRRMWWRTGTTAAATSTGSIMAPSSGSSSHGRLRIEGALHPAAWFALHGQPVWCNRQSLPVIVQAVLALRMNLSIAAGVAASCTASRSPLVVCGGMPCAASELNLQPMPAMHTWNAPAWTAVHEHLHFSMWQLPSRLC